MKRGCTIASMAGFMCSSKNTFMSRRSVDVAMVVNPSYGLRISGKRGNVGDDTLHEGAPERCYGGKRIIS